MKPRDLDPDKEYRREYMREYFRKRRADPEFREKKRLADAAYRAANREKLARKERERQARNPGIPEVRRLRRHMEKLIHPPEEAGD